MVFASGAVRAFALQAQGRRPSSYMYPEQRRALPMLMSCRLAGKTKSTADPEDACVAQRLEQN